MFDAFFIWVYGNPCLDANMDIEQKKVIAVFKQRMHTHRWFSFNIFFLSNDIANACRRVTFPWCIKIIFGLTFKFQVSCINNIAFDLRNMFSVFAFNYENDPLFWFCFMVSKVCIENNENFLLSSIFFFTVFWMTFSEIKD